MARLTTTSKFLIALILLGTAGAAVYTRRDHLRELAGGPRPELASSAVVPTVTPSGTGKRP
jgi:hypothetical protein